MSVNSSKSTAKTSTASKGTKQGSFQPPSTSQRRNYELVSPTTPEGPASLPSIRAMFHEFLEPVKWDLDLVKGTVEATSAKLEIAVLTQKCVHLEAENVALKYKLKKLKKSVTNWKTGHFT